MKAFRLTKSRYSNDVSGRGAEKAGGRWNSKGIAMLYTSESIALSTTEIAVHIPLGILPKNYDLVTLEIPDSIIIEELLLKRLPADWKSYPHANSTQMIGDDFIRCGRSLVLKVPSAVIQGDFNYLINPSHPEMKRVSIADIQPYQFDERLFLR